ncbi:hypothetical protein CH286_03435 [Rhodococcus sp. WWJCD1]|nr:hypothetical protein CH286_03435 [Rhodococcus sp. WWJCD1]
MAIVKQVAAARHCAGHRRDQVQGGAVLVSGVIGSRFDTDETLDIAGRSPFLPQTRAPLSDARRLVTLFRSHLTNARACADP